MDILVRYGASSRFFAEAEPYRGLSLARVIAQYKNLYKIVTSQGEVLAEVSGKFRHAATGLSAYPAVGDFVMAAPVETGAGKAVISKVLKRKSVFERTAVGLENQRQVVAANIDIVFLCMSLNNDYNLSRLERYLSVAWSSGALPVVVLTKADLCGDLPAVLDEISKVALGVGIATTSAQDPDSCDKLLPYLTAGMTASFIGSSGVGKSTLINRLAGEELLATSAIRQDDDRGRHTTTRRELLVLPQGGIVIDTPGMRELGAESADLSRSFADIEALIGDCRFGNCTHSAEPGCAVREALATGALDERRWANYQKLKREARYSGLSAKQIESAKLNNMFEGVGGMKKARAHLRQTDKRK